MASETQQNLGWKQNKRKASSKTSALPTRSGRSIQETQQNTLNTHHSLLLSSRFHRPFKGVLFTLVARRHRDIKSHPPAAGTDLSRLAIVSQRLSVIRHVFSHKLLSLVEEQIGESSLQRLLQPAPWGHRKLRLV